jgi:DNA polymerase elongation subunit (family B)
MSRSNYIGAVYDWDSDKVLVWERDSDGNRVLNRWKAEHYFYAPVEIARAIGDNVPYSNVADGYRSLYEHDLIRFDFDTRREFEEAKRAFPAGSLFESDIPTELKILMNHYADVPTPVVNFAFLDIEVDYKSKLGFSGPKNPYAVINAITIYQSWNKTYKQYVVPPAGWAGSIDTIRAEFTRLMEEKNLTAGIYPEIVICKTEAVLLQHMVEELQDADIISGWNSEFFDLPYIMRRLELVWPGLVAKMCFPGCRKPKQGEVDKFGAPELVYTIFGRSHLDYKDLFEKFTFEGRESYALGNILAEELDIGKLHYEGTLEQLYHNDFETFCAYNFRDVSGMVDLEGKYKFITMVNQMAHENTVNFSAMLGTVRYVETGIANFCHTKKNLIVPDKRPPVKHDKVEGAIVLTPKIGLWEFLGSVDLVSLYPTEIMSLNISPEMFIGQFIDFEATWFGIMFGEDAEGNPIEDETIFRLKFDNAQPMDATAVEWREVLVEQKWALTAYGTIFDQSKGMGLVPEVLSYWFTERKRLQGEKKKYGKLAREEQDPVKKAEYEKQEEHFDLLQLTKKIQLNSTYGALLNIAFRFGRVEMGASVTACGRATTTHMMQTIHEYLEGTCRKLIKTTEVEKDGKLSHAYGIDSEVIIYGDTDSCYFRTKATNKEDGVRIADAVAAHVNAGWPDFMVKAFNVQPTFNGRMKAGREVVAERGLFQAKKKYVLKVVDLEGVTPAGGYKLKSQGSEIKKSDTPKIIQGFLKDLMGRILSGESYPEVEAFVNAQRKALLGKSGDIFMMGVAKQANNLDAYYAAWVRAGRPNAGKVLLVGEEKTSSIPGQVRAAFHYNEIAPTFEEGAKLIRSGDKARIFYLKANARGWKSIGLPAELERFPDWFAEEFQVDKRLTEEKMFDNKLKGIFGAIGWEVPTPQNTLINSILKF